MIITLPTSVEFVLQGKLTLNDVPAVVLLNTAARTVRLNTGDIIKSCVRPLRVCQSQNSVDSKHQESVLVKGSFKTLLSLLLVTLYIHTLKK